MHVVHHLRVLLRRAAAVVVCAGLAALSLSAYAYAPPYPDFSFGATGSTVTGTFSSGTASSWSNVTKTPVSGGLEFSLGKTLPFKPSPTGTFKALVTPQNLGRALTAGAAVAIPLLASPIISALLNQACVRVFGGAMTLAPGGQWEECKFVQQTVTMYETGQMAASDAPDKASSCTYWATHTYPGSVGSVRLNDPSAGEDGYMCDAKTQGGGYINGAAIGRIQKQITVQDGWKPMTAAAAESTVDAKLNEWATSDFSRGNYGALNDLQGVLDELYKAGQAVDAQWQVPTVPSITEPGPTVTSQDSSGKTVQEQTSTKNDYSCIVIQNEQAVQCSQTKTETKTSTSVDSSTNTTTTSTTTTTKTGDPSDLDPCKANPDRMGCANMGTPTAADTLGKDTKNITITPATFAGGACPAPVTFTVFGKSYAFTYDTLCAKLQIVSVLLLTLSAFAAAYIFADGFRV